MIRPLHVVRRVASTLVLASVLFVPPAQAGEPTDQLRESTDKVLAILRDPTLRGKENEVERRNRLREAISRRFDFPDMARRTLARQWRKISPAQRKEFTELFSNLMEQSYVGKIEAYTDEVIRYNREKIDSDFSTVKTAILRKKGGEISIDYRLHKVGGEWRVYDIIIENVSLINNYRQRFRAIIRKKSYAELVKILRRKKEEG